MIQAINDSPIFRAVYEVWDSLRADGETVPTRDRFNPMALGAVLPNVVLVERTEPGSYIYRVAGTAVNERMKVDAVGVNMLDYFVADVRPFLTTWFEAMLSHACGTITRMDLVHQNDPKRSVQVLGLPMFGRGGHGVYYLFGNDAWHPKVTDDYGQFVNAGGHYLECHGVDIGAGIPDLPNVPEN
ncbi:MAG: PAS domain-containing protein [Alphaproteobacteria bacterium]|nr:MAG: PAS domain-containing protein [Alphaproteobacteria bacterium]